MGVFFLLVMKTTILLVAIEFVILLGHTIAILFRRYPYTVHLKEPKKKQDSSSSCSYSPPYPLLIQSG
jgi:hypothetical protein